MVPSRRVYFLLVLGITMSTMGVAAAPILSLSLSIRTTIALTLLFDAIILGLMVVDGSRVRRSRVQITRELPPRLSIGRDNPVVLKVTSQNANAQIQIRDYYPTGFGVSTPGLSAIVPSNSTQELTYTVHPTQRGEFPWGNIQVRQTVGTLGISLG